MSTQRMETSMNAKQLDYRTTGWGHTISLKRAESPTGQPPVYSGYLFSGFVKPEVGTEVVIRMASGRDAVFGLTEVRWCSDPRDMYFIKAEPLRYMDGKP